MIFQKTKWSPVIKPSLFGVYWDGSTNSSMLRTDGSALFEDPVPAVSNGTGSSPFDEYMPWAGMEIVEDADAGTLVSIPKFWYKWTRDSEVTGDMKLQISNKEIDGFHVSPAHADRGDGNGERDIVYVGRYLCNSDWKSVTDTAPLTSNSRALFRAGIHSLGSTIWQWDFAMYWTVCMLYLVEYADWDSQKKIGYGCSDTSVVSKAGKTDTMVYHTGTNVASLTTYGRVQYRHIEDLWSNAYQWVDGITQSSSGGTIYCANNPAEYSQWESASKVYVGDAQTTNEIKSFSNPTYPGYEYALVPASTVANTNYNSYVCDYYYSRQGAYVFRVGGSREETSKAYGLFSMCNYFDDWANNTYTSSRLMKLP